MATDEATAVLEARTALSNQLVAIDRAYQSKRSLYFADVCGSSQNGLYRVLGFRSKAQFEALLVLCKVATYNKERNKLILNLRGMKRAIFLTTGVRLTIERPQLHNIVHYILIFGHNESAPRYSSIQAEIRRSSVVDPIKIDGNSNKDWLIYRDGNCAGGL